MYDYAGGKADWLANSLPAEGDLADAPTAGSLSRQVLTCSLSDRAQDIAERMRAADEDVWIVDNAEKVVMGRVRLSDVARGGNATIEEVMESGPSTFRPNVPAAEIAEYMGKRDMDSALVTTNDGVLVGLVSRRDAEEAASRSAEAGGAAKEEEA